jgi:hypothetical protein
VSGEVRVRRVKETKRSGGIEGRAHDGNSLDGGKRKGGGEGKHNEPSHGGGDVMGENELNKKNTDEVSTGERERKEGLRR